MRYISVAEAAAHWGVSERSVRNYCAQGRVPGAFMTGKTWNLPEDAEKPARANAAAARPCDLLDVLREEKTSGIRGGIYHKLQVELTYNSNHIEGSRLTHEQTRLIFETNTIGVDGKSASVDDVVETANHFRCVDLVIDHARLVPSEAFIKELHRTLKNGTSDSRKAWFAVGEYKRVPNEVGGHETAAPEEVAGCMQELLGCYNALAEKSLDDILDFHVRFEGIHPFQDGNGRVGRLLLLGECLRNHEVPFVIDDKLKAFYYRGLAEWGRERGCLRDTCLAAQDQFKLWLEYFRIPY